jgi:gag-polyprotein putative aspartyl protease
MGELPMIIEPDPDDLDCAAVMVDGTIAGRPYRFMLDTGAARSQVEADEYTAALAQVGSHDSAGAFASETNPVITITDLVVGPLHAATLDVSRVAPIPPYVRNLVGMDVLQRHCCHFRFADAVVDVDVPGSYGAESDLQMDSRGHIYLDVQWPGVTGRAAWDTGSGATLVNRDFWLAHPELFEETGTTLGTDVTGMQVETPTLLMAAPRIGQRAFRQHMAVAVDLTGANSTVGQPMDLILGYPTLRQADWLFDFPARRWTLGADHTGSAGDHP